MASLGAALREHPHWGELSDTAGATAHLQVSLGLQNKGCCHLYSYIHSDVSVEGGSHYCFPASAVRVRIAPKTFLVCILSALKVLILDIFNAVLLQNVLPMTET